MFVHLTQLVLFFATLSNEIFCGSFWLKILLFVCATTVKWVLFLNHRNRKLVGGKHNVLVHYVDVSAPGLLGVVLCNPFKCYMSCGSFLIKKSCYFCVPAIKAKWIIFQNQRNRKVVEGKHNILVHYVNLWDKNDTNQNYFSQVIMNYHQGW